MRRLIASLRGPASAAASPTARRPAARPIRRPPSPRWVKPVRRLAAVGALLLVVIGAPVWLVMSGWVGRQGEALADMVLWGTGLGGLVVHDVLVTGRVETGRDEVMTALDVRNGMPILAFDPKAAKSRLEALPWIRLATVERRLPDTIAVTLTERAPIALWQRDRRFWLIDAEGVAITDRDVGRWGRLPLVVGEGAPKEARGLIALLAAEPVIADRLEAAVRVGARRWNLQLTGPVEVRLPEEGADGALARLGQLHRQQRLLDRKVKSIDLRYGDRLVLTLLDGGEQSLPTQPPPAKPSLPTGTAQVPPARRG